MSNFETVKLLITEMSGTGENSLAVSRSILEFMGELEAGVFLSQVIYFSDKSSRKDGYFYKTYDDWKDHTFMTEYSIRKNVKILKEKGYLETSIKKANGSPTVHYKFNMERFSSDFIWFLRNRRIDSLKSQNGNCENADSLTKITTKTTTYKKISKSSNAEASKPKRLFGDDSYEMLMVNLFISEMQKNSTLFKEPSNKQQWCNHVRLIIDIDLKDKDEDRTKRFSILKELVLHSCNKSYFYKNIRSIDKLRKRLGEVSDDLQETKTKQNKKPYNNYNTNAIPTGTQHNVVNVENLFGGTD